MNKRILIVDDEPDICEILRFNLEMEGYDVEVAEGPVPLLSPVESGNSLPLVGPMPHPVASVNTPVAPQGGKALPDLILLDVMMTPKSGFEWAKELKADARTANIPIIFCTAKTLEEDLLQGFAIGSDDYICKPFRISEVKARVKAVLKRSPASSTSPQGTTAPAASLSFSPPLIPPGGEDTVLTNSLPLGGVGGGSIGGRILSWPTLSHLGEGRGLGITLDLDRKECFIDGQEVVFTKLEFEVFALLLSKPGQVFSREKILSTVWPSDTIVLDRTVDVNITRIRKKIGRYGEHLRTKFGYGYMFG